MNKLELDKKKLKFICIYILYKYLLNIFSCHYGFCLPPWKMVYCE